MHVSSFKKFSYCYLVYYFIKRLSFYLSIKICHGMNPEATFLACRERQASIVFERYFRFEISLLSILCMLVARMEMGTSRVSGDSDIIT